MGRAKLGNNPVLAAHKRAKQELTRKMRKERRQRGIQRSGPRDIYEIEQAISQLESKESLIPDERTRLRELKFRLAHVKKSGNTSGPKIESEKTRQRDEQAIVDEQTAFFQQYPEKSKYYDRIYNPSGCPPPGMEWELASSASDDSDTTASSVRCIPMPESTPPSSESGNSDDDQHYISAPLKNRLALGNNNATAISTISSAESIDSDPGLDSTVIEAKPIVRNLQQEATTFIPYSIMRRKHAQLKAQNPTVSTISNTRLSQNESTDTFVHSQVSPLEPPSVASQSLPQELPQTLPSSPPAVSSVRGIKRRINAAPDV